MRMRVWTEGFLTRKATLVEAYVASLPCVRMPDGIQFVSYFRDLNLGLARSVNRDLKWRVRTIQAGNDGGRSRPINSLEKGALWRPSIRWLYISCAFKNLHRYVIYLLSFLCVRLAYFTLIVCWIHCLIGYASFGNVFIYNTITLIRDSFKFPLS